MASLKYYRLPYWLTAKQSLTVPPDVVILKQNKAGVSNEAPAFELSQYL
jgi:hypothetical protein